jgi:predicted permease
VLGAALGFVLAHFAVEIANREYYEVIGNTPARLDGRVVTACVLATLICTLAGALAPLLTLRRVHPADALRGEGRSTEKPRARRLRQALLIFQVAITSVLLINAGLIIRSVRSLLAVDAGFSSRDVVTAGITLPLEPIGKLSPEERQQAFEARTELIIAKARAVLERLRQMRGAAHATVTIDVPFDFHSWPVRLVLPTQSAQSGTPEGAQQEVTAIVHFVGPGYFDTLGTRLLSGTDFGNELTASGRPVCMVSQAFARALGVRDAVGRHLRWRDAGPPPGLDLEIIGMVEDTIENDLTAPPPLQLYVPFAAGALSVSGPTIAAFQVALRGDDPAALARELPLTIKKVLPDAALSGTRRMDEWVNKSFWQRSALSHVLSALALAAGVLSAIGLFGITSFSVTQRTGEVGIRRALGATRAAVLSLVLLETLRLVAIGALLGAVASWFSRQLLAAFLFGIAPLDPLTYLAVGIGVALVALLAALAPALAASRVNPTHALTWR